MLFSLGLVLVFVLSLSYMSTASFLWGAPTGAGGVIWLNNGTNELQRVYSFANRSGTIVLNVSFSAGVADNDSNLTNHGSPSNQTEYLPFANDTHYKHIVNVTFMFLNVTKANTNSSSLGAMPIGHGNLTGYDFYSTVFNTTANQAGNTSKMGMVAVGENRTFANASFDTTLLPDGVYSINVSYWNVTSSTYGESTDAFMVNYNISNSTQVLNTVRANIVGGFIYNLTIDNTAPTVTDGSFIITANSTTGTAMRTGTDTTFNLTSGNASLVVALRDDRTFIPTASIRSAIFTLDNASAPFGAVCGESCGGGQSQNLSGVNTSGNWSAGSAGIALVNFSQLSAGTHTARVYFFDYANGTNQSTVSFLVNTAPNVTFMNASLGGSGNPASTLAGANFSSAASGINITINVSLKNGTLFGSPAAGYNMTLLFDNATGNDFNISTSTIGNRSDLKNATDTPTGAAYFWTSIDPGQLAEGLHTVTVHANLSTGNRTIGFNNTQSISFRVDRTVPTVTVSCGGPYAVGATVTCTCTASDSNSGVKTTGYGDATTTQTFTASGSGGQSSTCSSTDYADNTATGIGSYTVTSSAGGGGTGGSSGGVSTGVTGQFEKKVWSSINAGETATVPVKNGVVGVTEVSFSVPETVHGAWLQVSKKEALPKSVAGFDGEVYRNLEITKGPALKDDLIKAATVKFKVEKAWIAEKQLPKESVALHHYADGAWTQLPTQVGEDDGTYVHYTATTPGFSYFVIGEKTGAAVAPAEEALAEPTEAAPAEAAPAEEAPAMEKKGPSTGLILALVAAVVVIAAVIAYLRRRR